MYVVKTEPMVIEIKIVFVSGSTHFYIGQPFLDAHVISTVQYIAQSTDND